VIIRAGVENAYLPKPPESRLYNRTARTLVWAGFIALWIFGGYLTHDDQDRTSNLVLDSSRDAWGADRGVHDSSLRSGAQNRTEIGQSGSVHSAAGVEKRRWTGMKRMQTSAKKGRRPTCFACGAWPVAELSIAPSRMRASRPFWKLTSGRLLILAACSSSFGMTTSALR